MGTIKLSLEEIDDVLLALSVIFEDACKHVDWFIDPECGDNIDVFRDTMATGRLMERFLKLRNSLTGKEEQDNV